MKEFLAHTFLPRHSNNHRAKLLHHRSLFIALLLFLFATVLTTYGKRTFPQVLGTAIDISVEELLTLTNTKRIQQRLHALTLNEQLSQAARQKAKDMFAKAYWAHNAPDGRTPWVFIRTSGYDYVFAGENLAKGFTNSEDIVSAWMASTSHRENMLSSNYQEIGFAVEKGRLNGEETVLVVEMFGNRSSGALARKLQKSTEVSATSKIQQIVAVKATPLINSSSFTKHAGAFVLVVFVSVLILDMIIVERRKIVRLVGHSVDHTVFLGVLLTLVLLLGGGAVL